MAKMGGYLQIKDEARHDGRRQHHSEREKFGVVGILKEARMVVNERDVDDDSDLLTRLMFDVVFQVRH